jgi:hypothetical protein
MSAGRLIGCALVAIHAAGCEAVTGLDQLGWCAEGCDAATFAVPAQIAASDSGLDANGSTDTNSPSAPGSGGSDGGMDEAASADAADVDPRRRMDTDASPDVDACDGGGLTGPTGGGADGPSADASPCSPSGCPACSNPIEPIRCCTPAGVCGCTPNLLGLFCQ